jgi:hypothetical protein
MSEQRLRRLLRDCLVQVDGADGEPAGSGFFAAPGYVLTCSHVVMRQPPSPVSGEWHGGSWSGRIVYASPPGGPGETIWPEPDLAVIRLDGDIVHPCVRLAARESQEGARVVAAGRQQPFGDVPGDFFSATMEYTGMFRYLMHLDKRLGRGMSGGPVLDLGTGEVCGVAKMAGPQQDGYAIPVGLLAALPAGVAGQVLRGHDRYHDANHDWPTAQRPLWNATSPQAAALLPPDSEAELLGLLARLPPADPAQLGLLYAESAGTLVRPEPGVLRELRDVAMGLTDVLYDRNRPHPVIIFAELLARQLAAGDQVLGADFRDWSTAEAARQGSREQLRAWRASPGRVIRRAGTATDPMSVVIQLEPSDQPSGGFVYTVWRNREEIVLIEREDTPLRLDQIITRLKGKLPAELGKLSGNVIVEFILPPQLFDEPVHTWPVFQSPHVLLGDRHPVVIRDWERFYDLAERSYAMNIWNVLSSQAGTPLQWLSCPERRTRAQLYRWLLASSGRTGLGMPGPAGEHADALGAALDAGARVAIWRLTTCPAHGGDGGGPCAIGTFCQAVTGALFQQPVHLLPEQIKSLRLSGQALDDIALLWDNPHRGPYPQGLAAQ